MYNIEINVFIWNWRSFAEIVGKYKEPYCKNFDNNCGNSWKKNRKSLRKLVEFLMIFTKKIKLPIEMAME